MFNQERISRLLNYKNLLIQLKSLGFIKIFSDNIADSLGVSSSLVRRDFASFGIKGNQKGGYYIDAVLEQINAFLGKKDIQKVILVGVGRIGEALINYDGFRDEGIEIAAGFDIDTAKLDENRPVPILPISQLDAFVLANHIKIAILAVPNLAVQHSMDILKQAGIQGILSFSSIFKSNNHLTINNINIVHALENLIYQVNNKVNCEKNAQKI